jgi:hypothetical protein
MAITTTSTNTPNITPISEIKLNEDNIERRGLRYRRARRKLKERRLMPLAKPEIRWEQVLVEIEINDAASGFQLILRERLRGLRVSFRRNKLWNP